MKKILLSIFTITFIFSMSAAFATNTYDIEELNLSITAPEGWITISRNIDENKPAEELLGFSASYLVDFLESRLIYIDFLVPDGSEEIFITMSENEDSQRLVSLNGYSEAQLKPFIESVMGLTIDEIKKYAEDNSISAMDTQDIEWLGYEIYNHNQALFVKFYYNKIIDGVEVPSFQYSTVQNGQSINISASSYTGELSDDIEIITKQVIDSIVFTKIEEPKRGIDFYEVIKSGLIYGCITGIVALLFLTIKKKKDLNSTPSDIDKIDSSYTENE
ncbi:MAG: hypothetical protein AB1Z23_10905 [Eubacteriales bacterium]